MDIFPLIFLLIIVLGSGGIALLADHLGRKLGKKRLWLKWRFLHLRPKHTAQAGVFLSGVVVSFLTIALVAGLSSDVRTWLFEGQQALKKLTIAKADLAVVGSDLQKMRADGARQSAENLYLESQVDLGDRKITAQQTTIRDQKATLQNLQGDIQTSRDKISGLQAKLTGFNARFDELSRKRDAINRDLSNKTKTLADVRIKLVSAQATLTVSTGMLKDITKRNAKIEFDNGQLEAKNDKLQSSVADLEKRIPALEESRRVLLDASQKAEKELQATIDQLGDTQDRLASAQSDLNAFKTRYSVEAGYFNDISSTVHKARVETMTYRRGEEVARASVPANASPEQAKKALNTLLQVSRMVAKDRGATGAGDYDAADIVDHYDPTMKRQVPSADIRDSLVRQLTGLKEPQVIIGASSLNAFAGEPVSLEVSIFPNPLVYKQGQVVAEAKVDGKKDQSEIFRQVQSLLADRLTSQAKQDKMIPRAGSDAEFGSVTAEEVLDLVDRVRKTDRKVTLRAIAEADTRAGDPLKLRFGIR